jgi:hypothetical protein
MTKTSYALSKVLAALVCLLLAQVAMSDSASDEEAIAAIRAASNQAISRHDVAGITSSLDAEYQINTGSGNLYHGSPEMEAENWAQHFRDFGDVDYVRTPATIEISSYLPRAAESGQWVGTWTVDGEVFEVGGSYTASWRKVDGVWKIQSEIFVSLYCKGAAC